MLEICGLAARDVDVLARFIDLPAQVAPILGRHAICLATRIILRIVILRRLVLPDGALIAAILQDPRCQALRVAPPVPIPLARCSVACPAAEVPDQQGNDDQRNDMEGTFCHQVLSWFVYDPVIHKTSVGRAVWRQNGNGVKYVTLCNP